MPNSGERPPSEGDDKDLKLELCEKHKQFRLDIYRVTLQTFGRKHYEKKIHPIRQTAHLIPNPFTASFYKGTVIFLKSISFFHLSKEVYLPEIYKKIGQNMLD